METLRELLSLGRENWPFLKDVLSIVGGVAAVLGALSTLTGIRKRRKERAEARKLEREAFNLVKSDESRQRAEWFSYLFRHKAEEWKAKDIDKMTIQQACGYLGDDLPDWARDGWERVLVGDLNKPVKKS